MTEPLELQSRILVLMTYAPRLPGILQWEVLLPGLGEGSVPERAALEKYRPHEMHLWFRVLKASRTFQLLRRAFAGKLG